jgi:hypothetical protein
MHLHLDSNNDRRRGRALLTLVMNDYNLAGLVTGLFSPLIVFHFVTTWISEINGLVRIEGMVKRTNES